MKHEFDYQKKIWGTVVPSSSPFSLAGLRFYYFLKNIKGVYGKALEIGCGAGGNLQALSRYRPYLELYGVDIGVLAITEGRRIFPRLHLQVASAETLPYDDHFFEIVCFFDVLEHVRDPLICLREACRVLKKDGVMHAYVPCEGEMVTLHGILNRLGINLKEKTAGHIQKLTRLEVLQLCEQAGLRVIEIRWSCHFLNQVGDIGYYLFLTLTGKRLEHSLEGSLNQGTRGIVIRFIKSVVSFIWYWESRIFWWLPGAGIHVTCRK